eukprot:Blabericola_migrator_1__2100@NODE_157_length_12604_cov_91_609237_g137_i0_p2_GENE_NODE_157_length_12604_cov_91_609237_g137_i0NODE_157_length_12604_cov_91_609237_g137_i0_p2_ORF_typecomplete_len631_score110_88La/PF05383_17/1_6e13KAR9/PF08580_10/0_031KAR9/PF08580_10/97_NODE_157_length_12604_cov_91_609237_g137_i01067312565
MPKRTITVSIHRTLKALLPPTDLANPQCHYGTLVNIPAKGRPLDELFKYLHEDIFKFSSPYEEFEYFALLEKKALMGHQSDRLILDNDVIELACQGKRKGKKRCRTEEENAEEEEVEITQSRKRVKPNSPIRQVSADRQTSLPKVSSQRASSHRASPDKPTLCLFKAQKEIEKSQRKSPERIVMPPKQSRSASISSDTSSSSSSSSCSSCSASSKSSRSKHSSSGSSESSSSSSHSSMSSSSSSSSSVSCDSSVLKPQPSPADGIFKVIKPGFLLQCDVLLEATTTHADRSSERFTYRVVGRYVDRTKNVFGSECIIIKESSSNVLKTICLSDIYELATIHEGKVSVIYSKTSLGTPATPIEIGDELSVINENVPNRISFPLSSLPKSPKVYHDFLGEVTIPLEVHATLNVSAINQWLSEQIAERMSKIRAQVDFYFSPENLVKDPYLQGLLKRNGSGVPIKAITRFNRIKALTSSSEFLRLACNPGGEHFEICNDLLVSKHPELYAGQDPQRLSLTKLLVENEKKQESHEPPVPVSSIEKVELKEADQAKQSPSTTESSKASERPKSFFVPRQIVISSSTVMKPDPKTMAPDALLLLEYSKRVASSQSSNPPSLTSTEKPERPNPLLDS